MDAQAFAPVLARHKDATVFLPVNVNSLRGMNDIHFWLEDLLPGNDLSLRIRPLDGLSRRFVGHDAKIVIGIYTSGGIHRHGRG
jgi:hypothetical protein